MKVIKKAILEKSEVPTTKINPYISVFVNFMLMSSVITQYGIKWPKFVSETVMFTLNILPTSE